MGEYVRIVNLTKKQYLDPFEFGSSLSPISTICGGPIVALGALLLHSRFTNGGILGSWFGDNIAIVSDERDSDIYDELSVSYQDITNEIKPELERIRITFDDFGNVIIK